jgi:hypothetical protein
VLPATSIRWAPSKGLGEERCDHRPNIFRKTGAAERRMICDHLVDPQMSGTTTLKSVANSQEALEGQIS